MSRNVNIELSEKEFERLKMKKDSAGLTWKGMLQSEENKKLADSKVVIEDGETRTVMEGLPDVDIQMVRAIIRGKSVMYRCIAKDESIIPMTDGGVITQNDLFSHRSLVEIGEEWGLDKEIVEHPEMYNPILKEE